MSSRDRDASGNGAFPRRYGGGCNCNRGQRHVEESGGCYEPEAQSCESGVQRETTQRRPTGGCGRPNCPKIVYPSPEAPDVEWEYTNYNRKKRQWPSTSIEIGYPEYADDSIHEESQLGQNYGLNYRHNDFEEEKMPYDCQNCDRVGEHNYQSYERVGGGSEDSWANKGSYLDYYYENESVDHQNPNAERVPNSCPRCCQARSARIAETDCREWKRVHF